MKRMTMMRMRMRMTMVSSFHPKGKKTKTTTTTPTTNIMLFNSFFNQRREQRQQYLYFFHNGKPLAFVNTLSSARRQKRQHYSTRTTITTRKKRYQYMPTTATGSTYSSSSSSSSSVQMIKKREADDTDNGKNIIRTNPKYFLLKSEPTEFSIQNLQYGSINQEEEWDGVRNYQARNILQSMNVNDLAFFYHSNCKVPSIVGIVKIIRQAQIDVTALEGDNSHDNDDNNNNNVSQDEESENNNDPPLKSTKPTTTTTTKKQPSNKKKLYSYDTCPWVSVRVRLETIFESPITLRELKSRGKDDEVIGNLSLLRQSRLSVHELTSQQWEAIIAMSQNRS